MSNLDRVAKLALEKHDRKLAMTALELALGKLVSLDGTQSVRKILLWYARNLKWF